MKCPNIISIEIIVLITVMSQNFKCGSDLNDRSPHRNFGMRFFMSFVITTLAENNSVIVSIVIFVNEVCSNIICTIIYLF